jgi:ElaB/YqjD/DUF883 family membrane-anchored ribosome-binding protein
MATTPTSAIDRDTAAVVKEAQHLLKSLGEQGDAALSAASTRAQDTIESARRNLGDVRQAAVDGATRAATTADDYVHANPWQSIGIGAALGVLAGYLLARR